MGVSYEKFKITLFAYYRAWRSLFLVLIDLEPATMTVYLRMLIRSLQAKLLLLAFLLTKIWILIGRERQTDEQIDEQTDEETYETTNKQTDK